MQSPLLTPSPAWLVSGLQQRVMTSRGQAFASRGGFPGGSEGELPAVQETQVQSLGQEDPLEKKLAAHSSVLAWRIPWTEEPGWLQSLGSQSRTRLSC